MNVIIWLVVGGAMGWMAHRIMKTDGRRCYWAEANFDAKPKELGETS